MVIHCLRSLPSFFVGFYFVPAKGLDFAFNWQSSKSRVSFDNNEVVISEYLIK